MQNQEMENLINAVDYSNIENVDLLRKFQHIKIENSQLKEIFTRYSTDSSTLTTTDLSTLLLDIMRSFNASPVLPAEALNDVITEFALEVDDEKSVSFTEFKTFFLYFHQSPLHFLFEKIEKCFCVDIKELPNVAAVVSFFVSKEYHSKLCQDASENGLDLPSLCAELAKELGALGGSLQQTAGFYSEPQKRVDIFVVMASKEAVDKLCAAASAPKGIFLMNHRLSFSRYCGQQLPRMAPCEHKRIAEAAAAGLLGLRDAYHSVTNFATEIGLTNKAKETAKKVEDIATDVDNKTGISGITRTVSHSARSYTRQATTKVSEVDEKMGVSNKFGEVKDGIGKKINEIKSNEDVSRGIDYFSRMFSSMRKSIESISRDTMDIVNSELQQTKAVVEETEKSGNTGQPIAAEGVRSEDGKGSEKSKEEKQVEVKNKSD